MGGMWGTAETSSIEHPASIAPYSPGQGGGAVSLRAFWLLGADGQAGRGPCPLCGFAQRGGQLGGCSRWEGVGPCLPPPNPARMPLGEACSLGMHLLLDIAAPTIIPKFLDTFPCGVPPPRQKPHHTRVRRLPPLQPKA